MNEKYPIGTIIKGKYTYDYVQYWKLYKITGYTNTKVRFVEIETKTVYDDGKTGPHYYDDPCHCEPVLYFGNYNEIGQPKLRNFKFSSSGKMYFRPDEDYHFAGVYEPDEYLEEFNLR